MAVSRPLFFAALLVFLILFLEIGHWIGKYRRRMLADRADEGATLVVGSILGLLAFVLALNLSNASTRYDRRMSSTLEEVNAVGTAMLQAQAVGGAQADELVAQFRQYLLLRRDYVEVSRDSEALTKINDETNALQNSIWALLSQRVAAEPNPTTASLMNAVNNAFDSSTAMRLAMEYKMPQQLVILLLLMSLLGVGAVGYQFGLSDREGQVPGSVLSILWCIVVIQIIDIGSARIWSLRTDARVYNWTIDTFPGSAGTGN